MENEIDRVKSLSDYLEGIADEDVALQIKAQPRSDLRQASAYLLKFARNICGAGYIGCTGGPYCDSDHK